MYKNVNVTIPIKRELMMNFIEKVPVPRPLPVPGSYPVLSYDVYVFVLTFNTLLPITSLQLTG